MAFWSSAIESVFSKFIHPVYLYCMLQSILFMLRKLHNGNSGKILPKDITPQDFFEDERTDIDIVVIYRRLKFYDDFEFNN